jgi:hypothetical protein
MKSKKRKIKENFRIEGPKEKLKKIHSLVSKGGTYKDLKRNAIMLGMPFPDVPACSVSDLQSFIQKSTNKPDKELVVQYDAWMDKLLEERGYSKDHYLRHYMLSMGYTGPHDIDQKTPEVEESVIGEPVEPKPEKKTVVRIQKKTPKKYLVEKYYDMGLSLDRISKKILEIYPEASRKSIVIWVGRLEKKKESNSM